MGEVFFLAPNIKSTDVSNPMIFEDKVRVFEDSVLGWQLEIADKLINGNNGNPLIPGSGYATLSIIFSYPEMIWQFQMGKTSNQRSKEAFQKGMDLIFDSIDLTDSNWVDAIDFVYNQVRCGLYHDGRARKRVLTSGDFKHPIEIEPQGKVIKIDPHQLPAAFITHFKTYVKAVRTSDEDGKIRKNFLKIFDQHFSQ